MRIFGINLTRHIHIRISLPFYCDSNFSLFQIHLVKITYHLRNCCFIINICLNKYFYYRRHTAMQSRLSTKGSDVYSRGSDTITKLNRITVFSRKYGLHYNVSCYVWPITKSTFFWLRVVYAFKIQNYCARVFFFLKRFVLVSLQSPSIYNIIL